MVIEGVIDGERVFDIAPGLDVITEADGTMYWLTMDMLKADGEYSRKVRFGTGGFDALASTCVQRACRS